MITGAAQMDGGILVVARRMVRCRRRASTCYLARQVGVPYLVVALNKVDAVDDPELLELVRTRSPRVAEELQVPGRRCSVVRVSALGRAEWRREMEKQIDALMEAVDKYIRSRRASWTSRS